MEAGREQVVKVATSATDVGIEILEAVVPVAEAASSATAEITLAAGDGVAMLVQAGCTLPALAVATWMTWKVQSLKRRFFPELCGCCSRRSRKLEFADAETDGPAKPTTDPLLPTVRMSGGGGAIVPWSSNEKVIYDFLAKEVQSFDKSERLAADPHWRARIRYPESP